jgi:hypothetical protein
LRQKIKSVSQSGTLPQTKVVKTLNTVNALEWSDPGIDAAFESVWSLILAGLGAARTTD